MQVLALPHLRYLRLSARLDGGFTWLFIWLFIESSSSRWIILTAGWWRKLPVDYAHGEKKTVPSRCSVVIRKGNVKANYMKTECFVKRINDAFVMCFSGVIMEEASFLMQTCSATLRHKGSAGRQHAKPTCAPLITVLCTKTLHSRSRYCGKRWHCEDLPSDESPLSELIAINGG